MVAHWYRDVRGVDGNVSQQRNVTANFGIALNKTGKEGTHSACNMMYNKINYMQETSRMGVDDE